jgi:uncharacterized protein YdeI (BOF family)
MKTTHIAALLAAVILPVAAQAAAPGTESARLETTTAAQAAPAKSQGTDKEHARVAKSKNKQKKKQVAKHGPSKKQAPAG